MKFFANTTHVIPVTVTGSFGLWLASHRDTEDAPDNPVDSALLDLVDIEVFRARRHQVKVLDWFVVPSYETDDVSDDSASTEWTLEADLEITARTPGDAESYARGAFRIIVPNTMQNPLFPDETMTVRAWPRLQDASLEEVSDV